LIGIDAVFTYLREFFGEQAVSHGQDAGNYFFEIRNTRGEAKKFFMSQVALGLDRKTVYALLRRNNVAERLEQSAQPVFIQAELAHALG